MAKMLWREPNEVMWRGWRPAHKGTQVASRDSVEGGTKLVYTVPAGQTLYLVHAQTLALGGALGLYSSYIRNAADALWFYLTYGGTAAGFAYFNGPFAPAIPLEVPSGYDLCIWSNAVGMLAEGAFFGWVE